MINIKKKIYKIPYLKILSFFGFIFLIIAVIINTYSSSLTTYFYSDNLYIGYLHEINKDKTFLDLLNQKFNIFKIPIIPFNSDLNFLSSLNYENFNKPYRYVAYIFALRLLEIITFLVIFFYFSKTKNYLYPCIIFIAFIYHFNIFDHQSYINFPIIIFNLFLVLSLIFKNNLKLFCLFFFIGNFWSYFINPVYFIVTCFGPFSFLIFYLSYTKKFKHLLLSFLINLPFTLMFLGFTFETGRFLLDKYIYSEQYVEQINNHYNFSIFNSKFYLFVLILFILLNFYNLLLKKNNKLLFSPSNVFGLLYFFFSLIFGFLYKYNLLMGGIPHPVYIDYSMQFILIAIYSNFFIKQKFAIKYLVLFLLVLFVFHKINQNNQNFFKFENKINSEIKYGETDLQKRFFWQKNKDFILDKKYEFKSFLVEMPNQTSDFNKFVLKNSSEKEIFLNPMQHFIKSLNHSFIWHEFYQKNINVNIGHSLLMDINSYLVFNKDLTGKTLHKNIIKGYNEVDSLNNIFNYDFILTDIEKDLEIEEILKFRNFELYIYRYPERLNYIIDNIYVSEKFKYKDNLKSLDSKLFLSKKSINKIKKENLKNFCKVVNLYTKNKKTKFKIINPKNKYNNCFAVFPVPYSKQNNFILNGKKIKTFKSQFLFHGSILKNDDIIEFKKNNLFVYPTYSLYNFIKNYSKNKT